MKHNVLIGIPLALLAMWLWGCEHDTGNGPLGPVDEKASCLGCHSSEEALQAALTEKGDEPVEPAKGGG